MLLFSLWLAERLVMAIPWAHRHYHCSDGSFFVIVAALVWRELAHGKSWHQAPVAVIINLYAGANVFYHLVSSNEDVDLSVRIPLRLIMVLLALLGGRLVSHFTSELLKHPGVPQQPVSFSGVDALSLCCVAAGAVSWVSQPQSRVTGWLLIGAGIATGGRLARWYGWLTWHEPLVLICTGLRMVGAGLDASGSSILGFGLAKEDAVHALTVGAIGLMTLAVTTRATLGHTGRSRHAGPVTTGMYLLMTVGALIRVYGSSTDLSATLVLAAAAASWSGTYLLFSAVYGPYLLRLDVEP